MTDQARSRLPDRRPHLVFNFDHAGHNFTAGVGLYPDGSIGELFINSEKIGSSTEAIARDAAITASLAIQHGASIDEIRHALTRDGRGAPSGVLGKLLDLLAAEISPVEGDAA